ncbi:MAG: DUF924 family protein [Pseudomonadota bacterium]
MQTDDILKFWFEEIEPKAWWTASDAFDELIRTRFGDLLSKAGEGELYGWRESAPGRLAEILVLDQFSRNMYRGTPGAFAQDAIAVVLSQEAVSRGALEALGESERAFLLMPLMHSESRVIHAQAEPLFRNHTPANNHRYEVRHKEIIDRFGRYPHRNDILGRTSTEDEIEFLKQPGSSF